MRIAAQAKLAPLQLESIRPAFLSRRDAATYLGVSLRVLDDRKDTGQLRFYKFSRRCVVFKVSDLDDFAKNQLVDLTNGT